MKGALRLSRSDRETLHGWADELTTAGLRDETAAVLQTLQDAHPRDLRALARLRDLCQASGDKRAVTQQRLLLVEHRREQGRTNDACHLLWRAQAADPHGDNEAFGDMWVRLGDRDVAAFRYARAAWQASEPRERERLVQKREAACGPIDDLLRKWAKADAPRWRLFDLRDLCHYLGRSHDEAEALARLADLAAKTFEWANAIEHVDQALSLAPPSRRPPLLARRAEFCAARDSEATPSRRWG
jgi:tetratricopeptide (TPR) repeat protein